MSTPARPADSPADHTIALRLRADRDHAVANLERLQAEYESLLADPDVIQEDRDSTRVLLEGARLIAETAELALERHASGSYGICARCGGPIGAERLEAMPEATTCVSCPAVRP